MFSLLSVPKEWSWVSMDWYLLCFISPQIKCSSSDCSSGLLVTLAKELNQTGKIMYYQGITPNNRVENSFDPVCGTFLLASLHLCEPCCVLRPRSPWAESEPGVEAMLKSTGGLHEIGVKLLLEAAFHLHLIPAPGSTHALVLSTGPKVPLKWIGNCCCQKAEFLRVTWKFMFIISLGTTVQHPINFPFNKQFPNCTLV